MTITMRAALYARVSSEEQVQGYSLDAQKIAFSSLVEAREWTVSHEYVEEGRSAHTDDIRKRPVFMEAMEDAVAGRYDVLVVHKIDRFSRKLKVTIDQLEKLGKAGVGFVSIENQIDYSTPAGKFMLVMQGGLAELYSDNLSLEVKKGKQERKAQGLYNGLLPFGVMKGEDGVPVPDPTTYPGLKMMFELAVSGKSDREIAKALNVAGHRTAGNQGNGLFSKDTVKGILTNRFYIGELTDGNGSWVTGAHSSLISEVLFKTAFDNRQRNRNNSRTTRADAKPSSLSGVARCYGCGGRLRTMRNRGVARMVCNTRLKRGDCTQISSRLDRYERQLLSYLEAFHIPNDYQKKFLEAHKSLDSAHDDSELRRNRLLAALDRLREMYKWGDMPRKQYLSESREIDDELSTLRQPDSNPATMTKLAHFLEDVSEGWREADQQRKNKLARTMFDSVWIDNQGVLGVTPRPELKPFFDLTYSELSKDVLQWRPRPDSNRRSQP